MITSRRTHALAQNKLRTADRPHLVSGTAHDGKEAFLVNRESERSMSVDAGVQTTRLRSAATCHHESDEQRINPTDETKTLTTRDFN